MKILLFSLLYLTSQCSILNATDGSPSEWNLRGTRFFSSDQYREAESCFEKALHLEEAAPAIDGEELATVKINLATVYRLEARYSEAEPLYRTALEESGATRESRSRMQSAFRGLALISLARGKLVQAEDFARRNVDLRNRQQAGPAAIAEAKNDLASVLLAGGNYTESEQIAKQSLAIFPESDWAFQIASGNSLNILGRIYLAEGRSSSANAYLSRAAPLLERLLGANSPSVAAVYANLAEARAFSGDWVSSSSLFEKSISTLQKAYGLNHPDLASALSNFGTVYQNRKQYKKAKPLFERALEIDRAAFGPESLKIAVDLNNLGSLAYLQHHFTESESLLRKAFMIAERDLGEKHATTGLLAGNLSRLYYRQKKFGEAEPFLQKAIRIRELHYGPDDSTLGTMLAEYAVVLRKKGDYSEAEKTEVRATRIQVRTLLHGNSRT